MRPLPKAAYSTALMLWESGDAPGGVRDRATCSASAAQTTPHPSPLPQRERGAASPLSGGEAGLRRWFYKSAPSCPRLRAGIHDVGVERRPSRRQSWMPGCAGHDGGWRRRRRARRPSLDAVMVALDRTILVRRGARRLTWVLRASRRTTGGGSPDGDEAGGAISSSFARQRGTGGVGRRFHSRCHTGRRRPQD